MGGNDPEKLCLLPEKGGNLALLAIQKVSQSSLSVRRMNEDRQGRNFGYRFARGNRGAGKLQDLIPPHDDRAGLHGRRVIVRQRVLIAGVG